MTARTLAELAALVGGEVSGDGSLQVTGVAPLEEAGPGPALVLLQQEVPRRLRGLPGRRGGGGDRRAGAGGPHRAALRPTPTWPSPRSPRSSTRRRSAVPGISPQAAVDPTARVDATRPGRAAGHRRPRGRGGAAHHPPPRACSSAPACTIGADCLLHANVVVRERCLRRRPGHPPARLRHRLRRLRLRHRPGGRGAGAAPLQGAAGRHRGRRGRRGDRRQHLRRPRRARASPASAGAPSSTTWSRLATTWWSGRSASWPPRWASPGRPGSAWAWPLWGQAGLVGHIDVGDRANVAAQSGVSRDVAAGRAGGRHARHQRRRAGPAAWSPSSGSPTSATSCAS